MALPISVQFPVTLVPESGHTISSVRMKPAYAANCSPCVIKPLTVTTTNKRKQFYLTVKAVDESQGNSDSETSITSSETSATKELESKSRIAEMSELGSEIKKSMEQRKAAEKEGNLLSGVGEEIKEIEWPVFGKVLGTTGVVLGVIAGSSVVLLTVNAVLAELSDRVFAGRGVQDFFG